MHDSAGAPGSESERSPARQWVRSTNDMTMGYAPLLMPGCHDSGPCSLVCGFTFEFYFWILLCMTFAKQVFGRMPWLSEVRTLVGKLEPQQLESPNLSTLPSTAADPRHGPGPIRLLCYAVAGLLGHRRDPTNGCCDRFCCCWRLLWPAWWFAPHPAAVADVLWQPAWQASCATSA